ncbi:riboflavin synthase [Campylobacter corcagiensis]|uniref:Riboflavin synthase n=1 Tax=Campylobacter corcagiensis TaxID=1448857 RepID=A0A7M1LG35_9BACT|nr:riboflavin synthase [Campylobacter corcagiensis]QKF64250.1 6,7-dimethyl-8-ribityllumazine synthase (riboflavin synthase, alpha subunit) [Campylobacter corcagiensis]QOQ87559.1 riboflavin synthase [Campylobacter corcagiensis]
MFNGLVREIGKILKYDGSNLEISSNLKPNLGDSIAVNGACLSVVKVTSHGFVVELSDESRDKLVPFNVGSKVHLEDALKLGDKIDGHLVQGHVDFIGSISKIMPLKTGTNFYIKLPSAAMKYMANKGSVAVNGVSLTISEILKDEIKISIIPITLKDTLFGDFKVGDKVNIESDMFARYVERILNFKKDLSWADVDRISSLY